MQPKQERNARDGGAPMMAPPTPQEAPQRDDAAPQRPHGAALPLQERLRGLTIIRGGDHRAQSHDSESVDEQTAGWRLLVELIDDRALYTLDPQEMILTWNSGAERMYGYDASYAVGRNVSFLYAPEDVDHRPSLSEIAAAPDANKFVSRAWNVRSDATRFLAGTTTVVLRDPAGALVECVVMTRNVTAQLQGDELIRALLESVPDALVISDDSGRVVLLNALAARLLGHALERLVGRSVDVLIPERLRQEKSGRGSLAGASPAGETAAGPSERILRRADGSEFAADVCTRTVAYDGRPLTLSVIRDASERLRSDTSMRESLASVERMQLAMRVSQSGLWDWDLATNKVSWNRQMFDIYGIPPSADGRIDYSTWASAVIPEDLPTQEAALRETIAGRGRGERRFSIRRQSDGEVRHVRAAEIVISDPAGKAVRVIGLNHDTTELTTYVEALRAALAELEFQKHALDEHAIVAITDRSGRIQYANDKFCEISKYGRDELLGQDHRIINSGLHPRKFFTDMYATIARGSTWHGEIRNRAKDGSFYWVETTIVPLRNADGSIDRYVAIRSDITKIKQAEENLRSLNLDLERKNRELDEFSYIASHDLQEPLRKLISFGELLPQDLGPGLPEKAAQDLEFITEAAARMQAFVRDLLQFSRAGRADVRRERVSLAACVDQAQAALALRIAETGARVEVETLPAVAGDPTLLAQLFQNLISNALKFIRADQTPVIRVSAETRDGECIFGVQDNGIGIKPEYAECIFAPFKRLHGRSEYPGTGIGLAICKKAVERHGGRIWVESEPGRGSHFRFTLGNAVEGQRK